MSKAPKSKARNASPPSKTEYSVAGSISDRSDTVFDLPVVDEETIVAGAAADAAGFEGKFKDLPRILRVALLINQGRGDIHERLVADVEALRAGLPETAAFATTDDAAT